MIDPNFFLKLLEKQEIDFFTGVPDSLLKDVCMCIDERYESKQHIVAVNEGSAVGLASGYHLATGKVPLVYMQNSGLGNAVNPLMSLADEEVYAILILMMIGWRGEEGVPDEPQHKKMGKITIDLLEVAGIPYFFLSDEESLEKTLTEAVKQATVSNKPVALVVRKGVFSKFISVKDDVSPYQMTREGVLEKILDELNPDDVIVSTTGKISRELFELREKRGETHERDFLTVGSMGHASQIALGISLNSNKRIICIDGDGSLLMHMGSLATNGVFATGNFYHIIMNNGCHESVGGQLTVAFKVDLKQIALHSGYKNVFMTDEKLSLTEVLKNLFSTKGPNFLEVRINKESREDLGRPTKSPIANKEALMEFLRENKN